MSLIEIGDRRVGHGYPTYIVAEISANHHQQFDEAIKLIKAAKEAGADAVKLQTYTPDNLTIRCDKPEFKIGGGTPWDGKTLYDLYSEAYMPWEWQPKLKKVAAADLGIACSPLHLTKQQWISWKRWVFQLTRLPPLRFWTFLSLNISLFLRLLVSQSSTKEASL